MTMNPQIAINEVVNSVKSEGLFDQFRKECLDEFENMETYNQLEQTVENHVASFLSRRRFSDTLQKNSLRGELRNHLHKSEVLINGIQRLVDEVLSIKGHGFCLKIDKQVDKYLNPPTELIKENESQVAGTSDLPSYSTSEPIVLPVAENVSPEFHIETTNNEVTEIEEVDMEIESDTGDDYNEPLLDIPSINDSAKCNTDQLAEVNNTVGTDQNNELPLNNSVIKSSSESKINGNWENKHLEANPNKIVETGIDDAKLTEKGSTSVGFCPGEGKLEEDVTSVEGANLYGKEKSEVEVNAIEEKKSEEKVDTEKEGKDGMAMKVVEPEIENSDEIESIKQEETAEIISESEQKNEPEGHQISFSTKEIVQSVKETIEEEKPLHESPTIAEPSYYSTLVTEPITDESSNNSLDSFEQISDPSDNEDDNNDVENEAEFEANRRKSHRKRNVPLKYREDNTEETSSTVDNNDTKRSKKDPSSRRSSSRKTQEEQFLRSVSVESKLTERASSRTRKNETDSSSKRKRSRSTDQNTRNLTTNRNEHYTRSRHESPEDRSTKRPRRPTKQRERYSPS